MCHNSIWWTKYVRARYPWLSDGIKILSRNVAEQLIEKGLAGVVRHKRDDEDRSSEYDKLMAAEQT